MQSVSAAWTAEEDDPVRSIAHNLQVSWKKQVTLGNRTFTIGVSTIGGTDIIGINPGAIGGPGNYRYFDETDYVMSLEWDRGLNYPLGGLSMAMAGAVLNNTSDRFTPNYMGGTRQLSELYTAIKPRRPIIIGAGFNFNGISQTIPEFSGVLTRQPEVSKRDKLVQLRAADYVDFFKNRYLDNEVMFTGQRTDQVLVNLFQRMGMSTAQYEVEQGLNTIPFGLFEKGTRFSDIMQDIVEAENAQLYQDEQGIFRFENRQHWNSSPYNSVQRVISTAQVLDAQTPDEDSIINVVEIKAPIREKQSIQNVFILPSLSNILIPASSSVEQFFEFQDPVIALTNPTNGGANSYFVGNSLSDGSGTDRTSNLTFTNLGTFARAVKYRITNGLGSDVYLTQLVLAGRVAKETGTLYYREQRGPSVTAYEERVLSIENPYIQNQSWAASYAAIILGQFSTLEAQQKITIRAIPELQLGDLISWQGVYWRIYDIKSTVSPEQGYVQELTMLKRAIASYFTIGVSTIGGTDQIAP